MTSHLCRVQPRSSRPCKLVTMSPRWFWLTLALVVVVAIGDRLALPAAHAAEEPLTAGECTLRGRSLARSLDEVFSAGNAAPGEPRTIVFVLDPSPSLKSAGFARALRGAVGRARKKLANARLIVLEAQPKSKAIQGAAGDAREVLTAVDSLFARPRVVFADVYAATRRGVKLLKSKKGVRELVLVTLENGDVESNLEATVKAVRRAHVRVSVLTGQAFLSDTYWAYRSSDVPRGMTPRGGESAFVELPWGWMFQSVAANEHTGSGFAAYGLSRLAAAAGGRVFLFDDGRSSEHQCTVRGTACAFCSEDHLPSDTVYQAGLLTPMAPTVNSADAALAACGRDPFFRATLAAWDEAAREGIVSSTPSVKRSGASLKPNRRSSGTGANFGTSLSFAREARNGDAAAKTCLDIAARLRAAIDAVPSGEGSPRLRANAEITYGLLRLTRVNMVGFAAWCREVGPQLLRASELERSFPEYPAVSEGWRPTGISRTSYSLCHGVRPFLKQRWPGGAKFQQELKDLADVFDRLQARYAHTPYGMALRRSTIARFILVGRGKSLPTPPRRRPNQESEDPTTGKGRTPRGGAEDGGSGGTSTGDE